MNVGLRIDVDTFRGTRYGVANLCEILREHSVTATFFFTVGPDNMGRHLWRLFRPTFLMKMLRSGAPSLYGWDILFKGTLWPGPIIGEKLGDIIRAAADAGHEIGFHAWDHHEWQVRMERMDGPAIHRSLSKGVEALTLILGKPPACSAAPAWKCNELALVEKNKFPFAFNSDCRGETIFRPIVDGKTLPQPQIPVTLPTYDEVIGRNGISDKNYNDHMLSLIKPDRLNVLTIHAEVEGIARFDMFRRFLNAARSKGISFHTLGAFFTPSPQIGQSSVIAEEIPGRDGWVARQKLFE